MELRKKLLSVAALAFATCLSAGVAVAAGADDETPDWSSFAITATSVRLDVAEPEGEEAKNDSGLRFKIDVPAGVTQADVTKAYTTVSFTSSVVTEENTEGVPVNYEMDINAKFWRQDGSGWNTVLLDIPASDYTTVITAKAYIVIGNDTYETAEQKATIAVTASQALNQGKATEEEVGHYVAGKVTSIELDQTSATLKNGETVQLNATVTPAEYAVVWSSDNEAVATVDKNGKVTAFGAGTANITASMGGVTSAAFAVTASYSTSYDFEDGVAPALVYWTYANANAAKSVEDYNGSKALVLSDAKKDSHGFAIDGAYVHYVFADQTVASLSFDMTYHSTKTALGVQITGIRDTNATRLILSVDVKQTVTITRAEYETWAAQGYEYLQFACATSSNELTVYIDNLQANEDLGEAPAWINWNSSYSVNPTKTMVKYNGVAAIKMTSNGRNNLAFEITQAHLDEIFADASVVSYSFDITYESEKGQMRSQMLFGYAEDQPILTAGQTYNYKITRADYNALKGDKLGAAYQFRMTWTTTYATTFYLANFTVNK